MDSLIVLRRPLRKSQVEPLIIIPKKSKKAQSKLAPIPPSPDSTEPPISFVKLYKEVCVENARHSPPRVGNLSESEYENALTHMLTSQPSCENLHQPSFSQLSDEWPLQALAETAAARGHVNSPASCSDTSLLTQYAGRRPLCHPSPFSATRVELILELDYDSKTRDSGLCYL